MLKLKHYLKKLKTFKFTNFFNYLKVIKQRYLNKVKISENFKKALGKGMYMYFDFSSYYSCLF